MEHRDDAEFAIDRVGRRQQLARPLAASFNTDSIAAAIGSALDGTSLSALKEKLAATQQSAENVLADLHLPHLPTRNEIRSRATAIFARTPSIDDIVNHAYRLILEGVGARLCPNS